MSDVAIRVENVSKRYFIKSLQDNTQSARLRDVLSEGVRRVGRKLLRPWGPRPEALPTRQEFWALQDISFEVKRGEVFGLLGRNGAGKSTLLKVISRITAPTHGCLTLRGRVVSLLEVGTGFNADLTGRENVFLNGAIIGMRRSEIKKKFDDIVAFAEVEKFIDMPVRFYSSGMYARLAFAVAIHQDPEILILDEVLSVGDFKFSKKCLKKIHQVANAGYTVLFVSHNTESVQKFCNRAMLLENGRTAAVGSAFEVIHKYLGAPPEPLKADDTEPPYHAEVA